MLLIAYSHIITLVAAIRRTNCVPPSRCQGAETLSTPTHDMLDVHMQEFAQLVDAEKQARLDAEAHAQDMQSEAAAARAWASSQVLR